MLKVVDDTFSKPGDNLDKGHVILESNSKESVIAYGELQSADARRRAIQHAASKGVPDPRTSGNTIVYPVDEAGEIVTNPKTQKIAAYRAEISITKRLV